MDTNEGHETGRKKKQQAPGAVTKVPGLCEVHHTGKRGDRTTAQKKRKSKATAKVGLLLVEFVTRPHAKHLYSSLGACHAE
eukprot:32872-Pelagomonas_calceolata.AAC.3